MSVASARSTCNVWMEKKLVVLLHGNQLRRIWRFREQGIDPLFLAFELSEHRAVEFAGTCQFDFHRIDEMSVDQHFVMEMWTGCEAGLAEIADHLALPDADAFSGPARETRHMIIGRHIAIGMLDLDAAPIA